MRLPAMRITSNYCPRESSTQEDSACVYKQGKSAQYEQDSGACAYKQDKSAQYEQDRAACAYKQGKSAQYEQDLCLQAG